MAKIHLNLDLAAKLLLDFVLDEFVLVHALERNDVALVRPAACANHVDSTELAFAERSAHFKVVQRPDASWRMRLAGHGRGQGERVKLHGASTAARFVSLQSAVIAAQVDCACRWAWSGRRWLLGRAGAQRLLRALLGRGWTIGGTSSDRASSNARRSALGAAVCVAGLLRTEPGPIEWLRIAAVHPLSDAVRIGESCG